MTATAKYSYRQQRFRFRNPDSLAGDDINPFAQLANEQTQHSPEFRLDADINDTCTLRFGYSRLWQDRERRGLAGTADPVSDEVAFTPFSTASSPETDTAWLEVGARLSDRSHVVAGGYWGRETGAPSVALPKLVVVHRPDASTWLSFAASPIFRTDALELAPVEAFADPRGLKYLSFVEGGAGRSYELRYQRQASRSSSITTSLTYQRVRGLLIDVQDPQLTALPTRVLMDRGDRWIADAAYEQWLTDNVTGRVWARWQSSNGQFPQVQVTGADWPYTPHWQAGGRLDYIDENGWRIGLAGTWVGSRFDDPQNTQQVGSYPLLSLRVQHQRNLQENYFLDVTNLTGAGYETFAGYPQPGRGVYGGVEYRY